MKLFRKTAQPAEELVPVNRQRLGVSDDGIIQNRHLNHQHGRRMVLGAAKDKYGMAEHEDELPTPSHHGVQAVIVDVETAEDTHAASGTEGGTEDESSKKKKKKKKKKRKKKAEDLPSVPVIDRVPTAMEYESDDSIEKMMEEKSRYSRYTTEYDELDLDTFDDKEDVKQATDKYSGGFDQIASNLSNDSNPPVWSSWDEEEEAKEKRGKEKALALDDFSRISKQSRTSKQSRSSRGSKTKSSTSSRRSKKASSRTSLRHENPEKAAEKVVKQDSDSWIAYQSSLNETKTETFDKTNDKTSIPAVASDTSSLTEQHRKREKYASAMTENTPRVKGPPRVIATKPADAKVDKGVDDNVVVTISSSASSENQIITGPRSSIPKTRGSHSGSSTSRKKKKDRYAEAKRRDSVSTKERTNKSNKKLVSSEEKELMYTKSIMTEASESNSHDMALMSRAERTKRGQMRELDEYSVAISVQDDPALVQCLNFYQCPTAAALAGFTGFCFPSNKATTKSEVQWLSYGNDELDAVDRMRYREAATKPEFEVILEKDDEGSSDEEDRNEDDATVDAPNLKTTVPNSSSYLREVTSLALQLDDGGREAKRQQPALDRGRAMAEEAGTDNPVTEIDIPMSSSMRIRKRLAKQKKQEIAIVASASSVDDLKRQREILEAKQEERELPAKNDSAETGSASATASEAPNENEAAQSNNGTGEKAEDKAEMEVTAKKITDASSRGGASSKRGLKNLFRFGRKPKAASTE
jgi:hypothetical protein